MNFFHQNIDVLVGVFLIFCSLCIFIIPPKYGNAYYGVTTKLTLTNEKVWAAGQRLFGISTFAIGLIFIVIGNLSLRNDIPNFSKVLLLIGLWSISKFFVHKILKKKFPTL